jgi:hypothetical protein
MRRSRTVARAIAAVLARQQACGVFTNEVSLSVDEHRSERREQGAQPV